RPGRRRAGPRRGLPLGPAGPDGHRSRSGVVPGVVPLFVARPSSGRGRFHRPPDSIGSREPSMVEAPARALDGSKGWDTRTMRRRLCMLLVAALIGTIALPLVPAPASASGSITFYGSGDGHGLGMSQWGAYGLATMGWRHRKILTHFSRGTRVGTATPLPSNIRIGLTTQRTLVHLTSQIHRVRLWIWAPVLGRF